MLHKQIYNSPLGQMILLADDSGLLGAWFCRPEVAHFVVLEAADIAEQLSPILTALQVWLDAYFVDESRRASLSPQGTAFQQGLDIINSCPQRSNHHLWQIKAINSPVSRHKLLAVRLVCPSSIFIPCHRVLGSQGQLTGWLAVWSENVGF